MFLLELATNNNLPEAVSAISHGCSCVGQRATATTVGYPGRTFSGTVTFISPVLQPETRTAQVRIELSNRDGLLKPAMFAEAHAGEHGVCIEWEDSEVGADNVYAWSREQAGQPSHEMFNAWMLRKERNGYEAQH